MVWVCACPWRVLCLGGVFVSDLYEPEAEPWVGILRARIGEEEERAVRAEAEVERLRTDLAASRSAADTLAGARDRLYLEVERLREAIGEFLLWDPHRAGYAAAVRRLADAARTERADDHA